MSRDLSGARSASAEVEPVTEAREKREPPKGREEGKAACGRLELS